MPIERKLAPNTGTTNESGFTVFPGGWRSVSEVPDSCQDEYCRLGYYGEFWSSSDSDTYTAWARDLGYFNTFLTRIAWDKNYGFSVRCLKD